MLELRKRGRTRRLATKRGDRVHPDHVRLCPLQYDVVGAVITGLVLVGPALTNPTRGDYNRGSDRNGRGQPARPENAGQIHACGCVHASTREQSSSIILIVAPSEADGRAARDMSVQRLDAHTLPDRHQILYEIPGQPEARAVASFRKFCGPYIAHFGRALVALGNGAITCTWRSRAGSSSCNRRCSYFRRNAE